MSLIVTIDGPAGSGKSTVSVQLGERLALPCIDTGATYRYTAFLALDRGVDLSSEADLAKLAEAVDYKMAGKGASSELHATFENQTVNLSQGEVHQQIRAQTVSMAASDIAKYPAVREVLVRKQREMAEKTGGIVNGRDAGTVICPEAPFKYFLTADPRVRAKRRLEELQSSGSRVPDLEQVLQDVERRDEQDKNRKVGALKAADDAVVIDSSDLNVQDVVERIRSHIKSPND